MHMDDDAAPANNDDKHLGPSKRPEGRYANYIEVGFNAFEFVLDFGQVYEEQGDITLHTRIVTGPAYAKDFLATLCRSIEQYEATIGSIPAES
jgi:hypothetical protein